MPGGVWAQQVRSVSAGGYGVQAPRPASPFDAANQYLNGGGEPSAYGRGDASVQKRQFADVGKYNLNLLDPLDESRAGANYQPIDGDGGLLGIGNYYNPMQAGGLAAGFLGAFAGTVGGIFGEGGAKTGSDIGTFLGKTLEMPLAAVGSIGVPFAAPIIDNVNSEIEKYTPYILRDTLKIPTDVGGAFQSMLNIFGLAGMAVERTYAGMDARGALPPDLEARIESGELTRDQAFDELVLSARGYSNDVLHNLAWNLLLDPANWASLGVGAVGGAVRGTATVARTFGAAVRADAGVAARVAGQGGRIAELGRIAEQGGAITELVDSRGLIAQMRTVIDDSQSPFQLSYVEKLGMSALGPVSAETGNVVAKVGAYVLRATDPVNFFSGSKAGQRSMQYLSTAASTGVMAAYKPTVVLSLANMADEIIGSGSERVYRAIGVNGANAMQEHVLSDLATDAMKAGAIPRTGKLSPTEAVRELLRGGAYDSNIGKYIEVQVERNKDLMVGMLPPEQMYEETVNKFAAVLGVNPAQVKAVMKTVSSDDAVLVHALYYYTKGEALHTGVAASLRAAKAAGTLNTAIDPERVAIISSRSLTNRNVTVVEDALKTGDVAAIRQAVEQFNDFNWVHNKNVPDLELKDTVQQWVDINKPYLLQEVDLIDPATGLPLSGIPRELTDWAADSGTFGYKLGQKMPGEVPEEALWRITRAPGKDGEILNANPYSDFWVEGGDNVKRLNRFTATRMAMTRGVRQERIIWSQRRRFITDMSKGSQDGGVDIPPALADRIFKALMYEAKDRFIQPRGMEPKEMYNTARRVLEDARKANSSYDNLATKLTERQVVLTLLRATQGEVALVGVTQKVTGGIKAYAPGSGANYWGRISERLYPLMRFTLNPVFQTMEMVEPYVLNSMRGIWTPLHRDRKGYQEALATRNAISQLIHVSEDGDGIAAETAEALATQAYTGSQAEAKFGRSRILRWMPHVGERKDVAAALETERIMGDHLYVAFKEILGDRFEAFWADREREFGTVNRGRIAKRWMAANFALQDVNGFDVVIIDDILKMRSIGRRFRINKGGDRGAYSFGDVERVLDHVRSYDGSWSQGLRRERNLQPGEALLEDLKTMSREEWTEEIARSGLNADGLTRISESAADDIWHAANGPELDEFWNGQYTVGGVRVEGYRGTYLQGITGTTAPYTRLARDQEIMHARAIVRAAAEAKGMTEEEFVKLHFEDIPRALQSLQDIEGGSLSEIREGWATEALRRGPERPAAASAYEIALAGGADEIGGDHPLFQYLWDTEDSGEYVFQKMFQGNLTDFQDGLTAGSDYFYDLPNKGYFERGRLLQDSRPGDVIVRMRRDDVLVGDEWVPGVHLLDRSSVHPSKWEVLTADGWKHMQGGKAGRISPEVNPRVTNTELKTGRDLYGYTADSPDMVESGISKVDADQLMLSVAEMNAREDYTGSGYRVINQWHRGDDTDWGITDKEAEYITQHLDRAIAKGQLREPQTFYRGIDITNAQEEGQKMAIDYENLRVGDDFADDAYFSTSESPITASGFGALGQGWTDEEHVGAILTVETPAGTHMALVQSGSEREHLFGRRVRFTVTKKRVVHDSNGTVIHLTIVPTGREVKPGVNKLALGEASGRIRNEGRFLQDATTNPEALRSQVPKLGDRSPDGYPYTAEEIDGITQDIELAISKAEAAKPPAESVTIGNHTYGLRTPTQTLDEIVSTLDPDQIEIAGQALSDLRARARMVMESEKWTSTGSAGNPYEVTDFNDTRLLAALAAATAHYGGFRFGLQRVTQVMERLWAEGPGAVTAMDTPAIEREIATHLVRGLTYGIEQPILTNRGNDTLDAILSNTSRRQTGRIDAVQPIVADDLSAEAAGYLTQSAYDDLVGQDLIYNGQPRQTTAAAPPAAPSGGGIPTGALPVTDARLGGSTGALQVRDPDTGKLYVDKRGANEGHIREESTTDRVYEALGVPVAPHTLIEGADPVKRAEMIEGATSYADFVDSASPEDVAKVNDQLRQGFALDALLANWDVIGLDGENVIIKNGVAYRIDNGGALRYRAMGELKGGFFTDKVVELNSLRDPSRAYWATRVFDGITDAEIRRQVLDLGDQMDAVLAALPPDLRRTVAARYQSMLDQTADMVPTPKAEAVAPTTPALRPTAIGEYEHEYLVGFYNDLAALANERGLAGKSTWTAADIAMVAGHARQSLGRRGGRAVDDAEFTRAQATVHAAVQPGPGSELDKFSPIFDILSQRRYRAEKHRVMQSASRTLHQGLRDILGLPVDRADELGVGLFDAGASPLMSTTILSSPEKLQSVLDVIAYVTGQPVVRSFRGGRAAAEVDDFKAFTARASVVFAPNNMTAKQAEKLAEALGEKWPGAGNMVATRNADGGWTLSVMDDFDELFPRLDNGAVDEDSLQATLEAMMQGDEFTDLDASLQVDYGDLTEAQPPRLADGSIDWDGYSRHIQEDAAQRGVTVSGADITRLRTSYNADIQHSIRQAAPDQYGRLERGESVHGRNLEDRRGGDILGVTSPRGVNAAVIRGFASADALTGLHELIHVFSRAGADTSLREVVSKAYDEYNAADDAAKAAKVAVLQGKIAATTHPGVKTRLQNQIVALNNQLQSPHPTEWGQAQEEFFVHLVYEWMGRGVPDNPELANAFEHFRNWLTVTKRELNKPGMVPVQMSPAMDTALTKMFKRKGVDTASYSVEQQTLRMASQQVLRSAWDEAHATQFYKRDRSMVERSINHPYIGLYPASYMWGKVLPEMLRFLALRPFGMETPFLAWNVAREVSDSVRAQAELDPGFKDWLDGNEDAFMLFSMLFPGLPHDIPANASLPVRRIAEQGLEAQRQYAMGVNPEDVKDIDFARGSQDAIQYALGPLGTIRTVSEVAGMGGNLVRSTLGSAQEVFSGDQPPIETLPFR